MGGLAALTNFCLENQPTGLAKGFKTDEVSLVRAPGRLGGRQGGRTESGGHQVGASCRACACTSRPRPTRPACLLAQEWKRVTAEVMRSEKATSTSSTGNFQVGAGRRQVAGLQGRLGLGTWSGVQSLPSPSPSPLLAFKNSATCSSDSTGSCGRSRCAVNQWRECTLALAPERAPAVGQIASLSSCVSSNRSPHSTSPRLQVVWLAIVGLCWYLRTLHRYLVRRASRAQGSPGCSPAAPLLLPLLLLLLPLLPLLLLALLAAPQLATQPCAVPHEPAPANPAPLPPVPACSRRSLGWALLSPPGTLRR